MKKIFLLLFIFLMLFPDIYKSVNALWSKMSTDNIVLVETFIDDNTETEKGEDVEDDSCNDKNILNESLFNIFAIYLSSGAFNNFFFQITINRLKEINTPPPKQTV